MSLDMESISQIVTENGFNRRRRRAFEVVEHEVPTSAAVGAINLEVAMETDLECSVLFLFYKSALLKSGILLEGKKIRDNAKKY